MPKFEFGDQIQSGRIKGVILDSRVSEFYGVFYLVCLRNREVEWLPECRITRKTGENRWVVRKA